MIFTKKVITMLLFLTAVAAQVFAQNEPADIKKAFEYFTVQYNANQPDSIFARFSPEMKTALPADQFRSTTLQLHSQLGRLQDADFVGMQNNVATYRAKFEKAVFLLNIAINTQQQYSGLFLKPDVDGAPATSKFKFDEQATEQPYMLKTFSGRIAGSLITPKAADGKVPLVLIIAGSGPTDRNGNSDKLGLKTNTYAMLANELAKNGIASLRYDKRLVGESVSTTKEAELKFEDMVEDALGLFNDLRSKDQFSKIFILGHSEGSLVGMLAAQDAGPDGFISVAGAADPAEKILLKQMEGQPKYIADGFKRVLDSLRRGKTTPNVDAGLYFIARPSVQGYLMSWCRYDPAREIKKLKMPVLILQGTTDVQVGVDQAEKLKKAKSDAQLNIIPGMNHILKEAPADKQQNMATYKNPALPLKPELVKSIVDFVKTTK